VVEIIKSESLRTIPGLTDLYPILYLWLKSFAVANNEDYC